MRTINNKGFAPLEMFVIIVFISIVGFVGYNVFQNMSKDNQAATETTKTVAVPATITTKIDASTAASALDQTSIDAFLDPAQLDNAINSLL